MGAGEFRAAHTFLEKQCDRDFVIGEVLRWELVNDRSEKSHDHFFALVHDAWLNLPEQYAIEFPNDTALRKFALIKTGYCKTHKMVTINNAEAIKQAAFMQSLEEYSICEVTGNVVTVWTADSQKYRAEGSTIWVEPLETKNGDGSRTITIGFKFCELSNVVANPSDVASELVSLMNKPWREE
jgi:Tfp pilus assembly protein PilZ